MGTATTPSALFFFTVSHPLERLEGLGLNSGAIFSSAPINPGRETERVSSRTHISSRYAVCSRFIMIGMSWWGQGKGVIEKHTGIENVWNLNFKA